MLVRTWAEEEFGAAKLGSKRRTDRLVAIGSALLEKPHGIVLQVMRTEAESKGAYRFLENDKFSTDEIEVARGEACLRRMEAQGGEMIIPVDQTSFHLPDHTGERDFGSVGNRCTEARGVQVLTALALDGEGVPVGVPLQLYWARSDTPGPRRLRPNKKERDHRQPEEKESRFWAEILDGVGEMLARLGPDVRPWLQCDRGADFWGAFAIAARRELLITVRVYADRQTIMDDGKKGRLMPWMEALPKAGSFEVEVPPRNGHPARTAKLSISYGRVAVALGPKRNGRQPTPLHFVHVYEEQPPVDQEPLCWKLATTYPVNSLAEALKVAHTYKLRWRIEELHRTLKRGISNLEKSQLESFDAFRRWAIIHTSVAARIERLKLLSRSTPDAPADTEFSRDEIDAAIILRHRLTTKNKPKYMPGDTPLLAELVLWIADLGGYAGPRGKPKPGSVPLARGLERLQIAVLALRAARELKA